MTVGADILHPKGWLTGWRRVCFMVLVLAMLAGSVSPGLPARVFGEVGAAPSVGEVKGRALLQERESSLGAYIEIGEEVTFVSREGYFAIQAPAEPFTMSIRAPGYLSKTLRGIVIEPGETLELRDITLDFGDGNGDEVIDIFDVSLVANYFGLRSEAAPQRHSGTE